MKRKQGQQINPKESKEHKMLKEFGKTILKNIGAKNICSEKEIDTTYIIHKTKFGRRYYVDVYGEIIIEGKIIQVVIECGSAPTTLRMRELEKTGCFVMWLGYNFIKKVGRNVRK